MEISQLKKQAGSCLKNDPGFRRLVLIHSAISAGVSLLLLAVGWLAPYLAPDGGLSDMDKLVLLDTVQATLRVLAMAAVPFWNAGMVFCALRLTRGRSSQVRSLTEGFVRWLPLVSSGLLVGVVYMITIMACSTITSVLLSLLPLPASVYEDVLAFMENPTFPFREGMLVYMAAYGVIYLITLCVFLVPAVYRHRQVCYRIMDDEPCGGFQAVLHSRIVMKGNRWKLFWLDASYWWFYLLELVTVGLSVGDLILAELGITLPYLSEGAAGWVFPILSLAAQVLLYWLAMPKIAVSYALFYQNLGEAPEPPTPVSRRTPWNY